MENMVVSFLCRYIGSRIINHLFLHKVSVSFIIIPAKARDYVFTSVGLSVCLFVSTITK